MLLQANALMHGILFPAELVHHAAAFLPVAMGGQPGPAADVAALPPGWEQHWHEGMGRSYFTNTEVQEDSMTHGLIHRMREAWYV